MRQLIDHLESLFDQTIRSAKPVSGGDISDAYKLDLGDKFVFLKVNQSSHALKMFETERKGLKLLARANHIRIPYVFYTGTVLNYSFIAMEWVQSTSHVKDFWSLLASGLANIHRQSSDKFGLDHSNFIGSLEQSNNRHESFMDFYREERIIPQFILAFNSGYFDHSHRQNVDSLMNKLDELIPKEKPAMIHGDLWGGNYMSDEKGEPCLIDPSVTYGHRESDLAMSRLFGGFAPPFYSTYHETFPLQHGFEERIPLFQLYYLLVHVNLFGQSYVGTCTRIIDQYQ